MYTNRRIRAANYRLACRIGLQGGISGCDYPTGERSGGHIDILDGNDCDGGQNEVVLVDVVQIGNGIKVRVPTWIRFYLIPNECGNAWNGFLYRSVSPAGFLILPLSPEWKINSPVSLNAGPFLHNGGGPVIQRRSEIMERIPDNEREDIRDWLKRFIEQLNAIGLSKNCYRRPWAIRISYKSLERGEDKSIRDLMWLWARSTFGRGPRIIRSTLNMAANNQDVEFTDDEIARRRDDAIRRAMSTPPKPLKEKIGRTERAQSQRESREIRARRSTPKLP